MVIFVFYIICFLHKEFYNLTPTKITLFFHYKTEFIYES